MSSKKNKSKSKKASEGDSSLLLKEDSSLQTSSHEGGSCKRLNNSFTVMDFIDKGESLLHKQNGLTRFDTRRSPAANEPSPVWRRWCWFAAGDAVGCWDAAAVPPVLLNNTEKTCGYLPGLQSGWNPLLLSLANKCCQLKTQKTFNSQRFLLDLPNSDFLKTAI